MSVDKSVVRQQMRFVNNMLNDWDFIGVADSDNDDEYECMVGPLTRMLRDGDTPGEIASFITDEVRDHFGMGDGVLKSEVDAVVAKFIESWHRQSEVGFGHGH